MSSLKFRAWDTQYSRWAYFTLSHLISGDVADIAQRCKDWCRYTGLLDKNGKEIFEGDIVEFRADGQSIGRNGWQRGVVRWDNFECGWIYCTTDREVITREQCYHPIQDCDEPSSQNEVIGNIYENPDLLKGEK